VTKSAIGLTSTVSISINGARRNAVNWLVDGVSNVDVGSNVTLLSTPTLESIQEFKIITSSYAAEWPRSGGGVINIVTKGGTRKFSGAAYDFFRNDSLNANSFFRNRSSDAANPRQRAPAALSKSRLHDRRSAAAEPHQGVLLLVAGVAPRHSRPPRRRRSSPSTRRGSPTPRIRTMSRRPIAIPTPSSCSRCGPRRTCPGRSSSTPTRA